MQTVSFHELSDRHFDIPDTFLQYVSEQNDDERILFVSYVEAKYHDSLGNLTPGVNPMMGPLNENTDLQRLDIKLAQRSSVSENINLDFIENSVKHPVKFRFELLIFDCSASRF